MRRLDPTRPQVTLGAIVSADDKAAGTVGFVGTPGSRVDDPEQEVAWLRWTQQAAASLVPGAFLAAPVSAETIVWEGFADAIRGLERQILPILEPGRVGRRQALVRRALERAHHCGIRVGVGGHRVRSAVGFSALVVSPETAAEVVPTAPHRLLIATGLSTSESLDWARSIGAALIEGPAVAEPIRLAPVDVSRLRR